MDEGEGLTDRLEMLLVVHWLDDGAPSDGAVAFSATTAAADLGLSADREGLLALMAALSELEDRGAARVAWPAGPGRDAVVRLSERLVREAGATFGVDRSG